MLGRIELLSYRINTLQAPVLLQGGEQLGIDHDHPIMHFGILFGGLCCFQSTIEIIKWLKKILDQVLVCKPYCIFLVPNQSFPIVLKICTIAKHLLFQGSNLSLRISKLFLQLHDFQLLLLKLTHDRLILFLLCSGLFLLCLDVLVSNDFFSLCFSLAFLVFLIHSIPQFPMPQPQRLAHVYLQALHRECCTLQGHCS
ncbi:hypothetical protein SDC9_183591 [bioreactor metagenome]|uniref:Uncharacterized protein n=1 Tax=bioreactor metagenome TaxID=1076179 RepID=A0A645HC41_9ZZZZ